MGRLDGLYEPIKEGNPPDSGSDPGREQTFEELLPPWTGQPLKDSLQDDQGAEIPFRCIIGTS